MKKISKTILSLLFVSLSSCVSTKSISVDLWNKIPEFKGNQIEIIRKIRPQIDKYLGNPNDYYISEIKIDSIIRIGIKRLEELQLYDIKNGKKNITYSFYTDDSDLPRYFDFDKDCKLIKCISNLNHECKPRNDEIKVK
jgi:hypothetical protein